MVTSNSQTLLCRTNFWAPPTNRPPENQQQETNSLSPNGVESPEKHQPVAGLRDNRPPPRRVSGTDKEQLVATPVEGGPSPQKVESPGKDQHDGTSEEASAVTSQAIIQLFNISLFLMHGLGLGQSNALMTP
jgi:hypothetical protein